MRMPGLRRSILVVMAVSTVFTASMTAFAAPRAQSAEVPVRGLFGEVVSLDGDALVLRTKSGEDITVRTTADTDFRAPDADIDATADPEVGDRAAVVVETVDGQPQARSVMVLPARAREKASPIVHLSGVIIEGPDGTLVLSAEDRDVPVEFGLSGVPGELGTYVTLVGTLNRATNVFRARGAQAVRQTVERLTDQIEEIEENVRGREDQVHHVTRIRKLAERISKVQLDLLRRVEEKHPERADQVVKHAVENIQRIDRALDRSVERAVELRGKQERERDRQEGSAVRSIPADLKPTLADLAEALGLTEAQLLAVLRQGRTLAQAPEERGLTIDGLYERVINRIKERLEPLADAGELDPDAVGLVLADIRESLAALVKRVFADEQVRPELPFTVADLAKLLGIEPERFFALLREGRSAAEVAEELGIDRETLQERLLALARERAAALVESGALTEDQVGRFIEALADKARAALTTRQEKPEEREARERPVGRGKPADLGLSLDRELLARILGLTTDELVALLKEGATIPQIAERKGVAVDEVIEKLLAPVRSRIGAGVEEGTIDRERAAKLLKQVRQQIVETLRSFRADRPSVRPVTRSSKPTHDNALYRGVPLSARDVADVIGVPVDELQRWLGSDRGVRGLLEERDIDPEELATKLLALVEERLTARAEGGGTSHEKVVALLTEAKRRLLVDFGVRQAVVQAEARVRKAAQRAEVVPFDLAKIAEALSITVGRLRALLAEGLTIAQIADRAEVSVDHIREALTAAAQRQAKALVEEGRASEDKVREKLALEEERVSKNLREFRLGSAARERLQDSKRQDDSLLTDQERTRKGEERTRKEVERRRNEAGKLAGEERAEGGETQRVKERTGDLRERLREQLQKRREAGRKRDGRPDGPSTDETRAERPREEPQRTSDGTDDGSTTTEDQGTEDATRSADEGGGADDDGRESGGSDATTSATAAGTR